MRRNQRWGREEGAFHYRKGMSCRLSLNRIEQCGALSDAKRRRFAFICDISSFTNAHPNFPKPYIFQCFPFSFLFLFSFFSPYILPFFLN